jgi:serine phosphatase RsbU (regulator of sigma subunit)
MLFINLLTVIYFACGLFLFLLAWLIVRENPRQKINRILSVLLFFAAIAPILAAFGFLLQNSPTINPESTTIQAIFFIWEFFFPQLFLFALVFPTQNKILKSHPRLYIFLYLPPAFHILLITVFANGDAIRNVVQPENLLPTLGIVLEPIRFLIGFLLTSFALLRDYHEAYFAFINVIYIVAALAIMHFSYAKMSGLRLRKQVRLVLWGLRVGTGLFAITFLLPEIFRIEVAQIQSHSLTVVGLTLGIGALTWAIIRHQFLEIQYIIRRGFIVTATSGLLAGAYLLLYGQINRLADLAFGENAMFVQTLLLIFTVIAFQPVLNLIELTVDRVFGKGIGDSRDAIQQLSREVLTLLDTGQLRDKVVNGLTESMLLEVVYLLLPESSRNYSTPTPAGPDKSFLVPSDSEITKLLADQQRPVYVNELFPHQAKQEMITMAMQLRIHLFIPLHHRDRLLGILAVGRKITRTDYSHEELGSLSLLADQLAISLENIQLYLAKLEKERYEKEVAVAKEIQQLLLPQKLPKHARYELCGLNIPSYEIGGDYYDFVEISDSQLGIAIGDVSGKGIPGAIMMSNLQAVFRANALRNASPKSVVTHVNKHLASSISPEKFVTFLYGVLDVRSGKFTFTNAGHNYPMLCRNGEIASIVGADLIVGVRPDCEYKQQVIKIKSGDLLVFYTDGITEAFGENEKLFGEQRLMNLLQKNSALPVENLMDKVLQDVSHYTGSEQFIDDLTLVLIRLR